MKSTAEVEMSEEMDRAVRDFNTVQGSIYLARAVIAGALEQLKRAVPRIPEMIERIDGMERRAEAPHDFWKDVKGIQSAYHFMMEEPFEGKESAFTDFCAGATEGSTPFEIRALHKDTLDAVEPLLYCVARLNKRNKANKHRDHLRSRRRAARNEAARVKAKRAKLAAEAKAIECESARPSTPPTSSAPESGGSDTDPTS